MNARLETEMKNMVLAAVFGLLSAQAHACPLSDSLAARYGISFSGFSTAVPESTAPDTGHGGPFVRVRMPDASNVADGFHHTIVMDRSTNKVWILRTGGFVGVYQWYGPVDAVDASLTDCRLEPADNVTQRPQKP
nr:hypothetical protein [Massilia sp. PDC64]